VEVGPGGTLIVNSAGTPGGAAIDGNVVANQCNTVAMFNIIVGNNIDIEDCTVAGKFPSPRHDNESIPGKTQIGGNFTCNYNSPHALQLAAA
jgi:hypothetical protein